MASKGSVSRGAKPDPPGCNGQLDLEARFKDPPGRFKPVDLARFQHLSAIVDVHVFDDNVLLAAPPESGQCLDLSAHRPLELGRGVHVAPPCRRGWPELGELICVAGAFEAFGPD